MVKKPYRWLLALLLPCCLTSCAETRDESDRGAQANPAATTPIGEVSGEEEASFELYSTLAGKMARMEELLNGVDRFLGQPDFRDRLLVDAAEFRRLTMESRELFPEALIEADQPGFREAIDRATKAADDLIESLRAQRKEGALAALQQLDRIRRDAHEAYSY